MRVLARLASLVSVTALSACAQAVPEPKPAPAPAPSALAPSVTPAPSSPAPSATESLPGLDALAARGPSVAAGMREVARGEIAVTSAPTERVLARADAADTCLRVVLAAQPAVHAWLTDTRGDRLIDASDVANALLAPEGPLCVRKGDAVTLHVEARAPYGARYVAWAAP